VVTELAIHVVVAVVAGQQVVAILPVQRVVTGTAPDGVVAVGARLLAGALGAYRAEPGGRLAGGGVPHVRRTGRWRARVPQGVDPVGDRPGTGGRVGHRLPGGAQHITNHGAVVPDGVVRAAVTVDLVPRVAEPGDRAATEEVVLP